MLSDFIYFKDKPVDSHVILLTLLWLDSLENLHNY